MRLSVIMPVYNAMPFLPEALASITSQTYEEFQLLIVDDGSNDGSSGYLKSIHDERVSIVTCTTRCGQGAARNLALARCNTEFTAFMDADDVSLARRFERQVEYLDGNREIGALGTRISYMGESGRVGFTPPLALSHEQIREDLLRQRHALVNATVMYRTHILKNSGGFRINGAGEDWDLFLRMTELSRVANLDEILYLYRIHKGSTNAMQAQQLTLRYAHACECARIRCKGAAERSFEEFCERQRRRAFWHRWVDQLNGYASLYYREAMDHILNDSPVMGYARLALAATLSPGRLVQRARRTIRAARPFGRTFWKSRGRQQL